MECVWLAKVFKVTSQLGSFRTSIPILCENFVNLYIQLYSLACSTVQNADPKVWGKQPFGENRNGLWGIIETLRCAAGTT